MNERNYSASGSVTDMKFDVIEKMLHKFPKKSRDYQKMETYNG